MKRRHTLPVTLVGIVFATAASGTHAQTSDAAFPVRNMRFIVPFGSGSGPDALGRRLAQGLAEKTGRNIIVDNRVGASGLIGIAELARAVPDGHTIAITNLATPVAQVMMSKPPADLALDVTPVAQLFRQYTILVVRPNLPVKSAKDLVDMMKEKPGAYTFASGGSGTPAHLAGEMFVRAVGAKAVHVPYKGIVPAAVSDIIRGDVLFACSVVSNVATLVQGGRLKGLAIVGPKRLIAFPEVPSFTEAGIPDPDVSSWTGVVAPKDTPVAIRQKLNRLLREIADDPAHAKAFVMLGTDPAQASVEQFGDYIKSELKRWAKFVKETNIRID